MCGWLNKVIFFLNVGEISRSDTIQRRIRVSATVHLRQDLVLIFLPRRPVRYTHHAQKRLLAMFDSFSDIDRIPDRIRRNSLRLPGSGGLSSRAGRDGVGMVVESTAALEDPIEVYLNASSKDINLRSVHANHVTIGYYLICLSLHGIANFAFRLSISTSFFFSECRKPCILGSIAEIFTAITTKAKFPFQFPRYLAFKSRVQVKWYSPYHDFAM